METLPLGALLRNPGNPDLIDARVVSADAEFVVVSIQGDSQKYRRDAGVFRRWLLPARTAVTIEPVAKRGSARSGTVVGLQTGPDDPGLWTYYVETDGGTEEVGEHRLRVLKIESQDPVMRLEMNAWRGPRRFFARLRLLDRTTVWKLDSEGIPALLGARVEPLFHQFYAARRCLLDREVRFLLADEVGLGKTIEAGLVIQSLLAAKPDLRVLVVAPGTTSRQWLAELYSRFGGRVFTHVDAVRYGAATANTTLLRSDRLIVTTGLLRTQPKALSAVTQQGWDLLVIDEGHHLVNWNQLMVPLARVSAAASGCLVLTATPGRGDDQGLLALLKLVAPATYEHVTADEFANRLVPQRKITEKLHYSEQLVAALLSGAGIQPEDARDLASDWRGQFPDDSVVVDRLARMENGDGKAAEELIAHIQEHYRVDRRIIRTRRRTLREYGAHHAPRGLQCIEYEASFAEVSVVEQVAELVGRKNVPAVWKAIWSRTVCTTPLLIQGMLQTRLAALPSLRVGTAVAEDDPLAADFGPAEEEAATRAYLLAGPTFPGEVYWLNETLTLVQRWSAGEGDAPARFVVLYKWLGQHMHEDGKKILVFSQSRQVVEELAGYLRSVMARDSVEVMTHNLADDELAAVARRFESRPRCKVLVSDEIGAEGRNFQFADALVHLDQPGVVARIEQRVGRLDRIGRAMDREVLSVVVIGPSDLERAVLELNRGLFRVYEQSIGGLEYLLPRVQQQIASALGGGPKALAQLAEALRSVLGGEEQRVDEAFSFFLDSTRPELDRAKELADLVADRTGDEDESHVREWCNEIRVRLIPQENQCVKVEVRAERLDAPLSVIGPDDWVKIGTFSRRLALDDQSLQYFAPGHIFMDALLQSAEGTQDARATAFFRDLGFKVRGRVFCVVVGRLGPNEGAFAGGVSPALLRRAEHYLPLEWVRAAYEILQEGDTVVVPPGALLEGLTKDLQLTDRKCSPDHLSQVVERCPQFWVGLRAAVENAMAAFPDQKRDEVKAAANELEEALRSEMAFLRSQRDFAALHEREALLTSVRSPSLVIDAVAVVIAGEGR